MSDVNNELGNIFVELHNVPNTTYSLFKLLKMFNNQFLSVLFLQFVISLTKRNFSKENIIYYLTLHVIPLRPEY